MKYLKSFIIGTSGFAIFPLLTNYTNYSKYNYDKKLSFIIPIYYGLLCILSQILTRFNISHQYSLFIISLLSCIVVILINHIMIDKYHITNKSVKHKTYYYLLQDITRELITFNLIIYTLYNLFDKYDTMKIFIIGSSIFSYYFNYYSVSKGAILTAGSGGNKNVVNYDYKDFAITEPVLHGLGLIIGLYIGIHVFRMNLIITMILYQIISTYLTTLFARKYKVYILNDKDWIMKYFLRLSIMCIIRGFIIIALIKYFMIKYYLK